MRKFQKTVLIASFISSAILPLETIDAQSPSGEQQKWIAVVKSVSAQLQSQKLDRATERIEKASASDLQKQPELAAFLRAQLTAQKLRLAKSPVLGGSGSKISPLFSETEASLKVIEDLNQKAGAALGLRPYTDLFRAEILEALGRVAESQELRLKLVADSFPSRSRGKKKVATPAFSSLPPQVATRVLHDLLQSIQPPTDEPSGAASGKAATKSFQQTASAALTQFASIAKKTKSASEHADLLIEALRIHIASRRSEDCKIARELFTRHPEHPRLSDWKAVLTKTQFYGRTLNCSTTMSDIQKRHRKLVLSGQADRVAEEVADLRSMGLFDPWSISSLELQSLLASNGSEAMKRTDDILKQFETSQSGRAQYWAYRAKYESRIGKVAESAASYQRAHQLDRRGKHSIDYLMSSGFASYQIGDEKSARAAFQSVEKMRPKSKQARDARWYQAWMDLRAGRLDQADRIFEKELKMKKGSDRMAHDRAEYWRAVIAHRLQKVDQAKELWRDLIEDPSFGYYGVLAWYRWRELKDLTPDEKKLVLGGSRSVRDVAAVLNLAEGTTAPESARLETADDDTSEGESADVTDPPVEVEPGVEQDAEPSVADASAAAGDELGDVNDQAASALMTRVELLRAAGLMEESEAELLRLERAISSLKRGVEGKKWLIAELARLGRMDRSSRIAEIDLGYLRLKNGVAGAQDIWMAAFPLAYQSDVEKSAQTYNVPKELAWSIMRAESNYRPEARSPVGAIGLMQVMPFTGERVATELLNWQNFRKEQLAEPDKNIQIGVRYLGRLSEKFNGRIPLVAAAYNAGPHRVSSWLKSFGTFAMDEFIEQIPFLETRNYVKKVVRNHKVYRVLYAKDRDSMPWLIQAVGASPLEGNEALVNW